MAKPWGLLICPDIREFFSSLGVLIGSLPEEQRCHSSSLGTITAIVRANWLPKVRLVGFLGIKVICAPVLSVSLYPVGEWGILVSTEIHESPVAPSLTQTGLAK